MKSPCSFSTCCSFSQSISLCLLFGLLFIAGMQTPWRAAGQGGGNSVAVVSAASFTAPVAPDSIVAAYGTRLATRTELAGATLTTTLAGTTVRINGTPALLFFVSPSQINFLIPSATAAGSANIAVTSGDGTVSTGVFRVDSVAPSIFTTNASGQGIPAANLLRVATDNKQTFHPVTSAPIEFLSSGEKVFLILYPTGIRYAADPNNDGNVRESVRVWFGEDEFMPDYAGRQGLAGLDQINVEIPRCLIGRGRVQVRVKAGAAESNPVEIILGGADARTETLTTMPPSTNSSVFNQSAIFTAQVFRRDLNTPITAGSVSFKSGATILGKINLNGDGRAVFATSSLGVGAHSITADYSGSCNYKPSSAPAIQHTVTCPPITITPTSLPNGTIGQAYNQTLTQTGAPTSVNWTISEGVLPPGLSLNPATGMISGSPTSNGTFNFTVKATDVNGCLGTVRLSISVGCPTITILPESLPGGTIGASYQQTLTARIAGANIAGTWTISAGALPPGLSLSAAGVLSGVPSQVGVFSFTAKTTAGGCNGERPYSINIGKALIAVALSSSSPNPVPRYQEVTLIAKLSPNLVGVLPDGVIEFLDNGQRMGVEIPAVGAAEVRYVVSELAEGTHNFVAVYRGGGGSNDGSSTAFPMTVTAPKITLSNAVAPSSPVYPGDEITINGSGFSKNPKTHQVTMGENEITAAEIIAASSTQLKVRVPFGVSSGKIKVDGMEIPNQILIGTSVSGFVQEFKNGNRVPIADVTVTLARQNLSITTNSSGVFIIKNAAASTSEPVKFSGKLVSGLPFEIQPYSKRISPNRDNQFNSEDNPYIPEFTSNTLSSTNTLKPDTPIREVLRINAQSAPDESAAVITAGQVTFDTNNSTVVCPSGAGCQLALGVFDPGRTPTNLPVGVFSSTIAQILPFGATFTPGGKLSFPNNDKIPQGTPVRVFRYDLTPTSTTFGQFTDIGAATISADSTKVETAANAVTQASYYFVSRQWPTATVSGIVTDADGRPVRRAIVNARGQAVFTGNNGGFTLTNIPVITSDGLNDRVTVEISYPRPDRTVDRTQRGVIINKDATFQIKDLLVLPRRNANRPPQIVAPAGLVAVEGRASNHNLAVSDPEGASLTVTASGASFASITRLSNGSYQLSLLPPTGSAGNYALEIKACENSNCLDGLTSKQNIILTVQRANALMAENSTVTTNEDTSVSIALRANGAGTLTYLRLSNPSHGTLGGTAPNLIYTPTGNYNGPDSFSFKVRDANNRESNAATVFIGVTPVNDPPVLSVLTDPEQQPVSGTLMVNGGQTLCLLVRAEDPDIVPALNLGDPDQRLNFTATQLPPGASFTPVDAKTWRFTWQPSFTQKRNEPFDARFEVRDTGAGSVANAKNLTFVLDATWTSLKLYGGAIRGLTANSENVFACESGGGNFMSSTKGNSWKRISSLLPQIEQGADNLLAKGTTLIAGSRGRGLFRSTDNGVTWSNTLSGQNLRNEALAANETSFFANITQTNEFGNPVGSSIYRSDNDGLTWVNKSNGLPGNPILALAARGTTVFAGTGSFSVFSAGGGSGIYRSTNNGESWAPANNGLTNLGIHALAVSSTSVFAGTEGGVFRSDDNGASWSARNNGLADLHVFSLAAYGNLLLAGTVTGGIFRSTDGGATWTFAGVEKQDVRGFASVGTSLFAATLSGGVFRSTNEGMTWVRVNAGIETDKPTAIKVGAETIFVAGSSGAIYRSGDNGNTWSSTLGLGTVNMNDLALHNNLLFACSSGADPRGELLPAQTGAGVFRSTNNGDTWERAGLNGAYLDSIASNGTVLVTGGFKSSLHRSTDNGANWSPVSGLMQGRIYVKNRRFFVGTTGSISRSDENGLNWQSLPDLPSNTVAAGVISNTIYAGSYNGGLYRSADDGASWFRVSENFFSSYIIDSVEAIGNTLYASGRTTDSSVGVVFQSNDDGMKWIQVMAGLPAGRSGRFARKGGELFMGAGGSGLYRLTNNSQTWTESLPKQLVNVVFKRSTTYFAGTNGKGVLRSDDQGKNWIDLNNGLPPFAVVQAVTSSSNYLFAGVFGKGIYRLDSSNTWSVPYSAGNGPTNLNINAMSVGPDGATILAGTDGGLFLSANQGQNWSLVLPNQRVFAIAISSGVFLAGTYGGGVFRSVNGLNWTPINGAGSNQLTDLNVTALNIGADGKIYAGTDGGGIFRTTDGGQNWTPMSNGFPTLDGKVGGKPVMNVYAFAVSETKLYAGTIYGVFAWRDSEAKWEQVNAGLLDIYVSSLAVDGRNLIAGTRSGGVFISEVPVP